MFKFPDWVYRKLPSQAIFWLILWLAWFSILWTLSGSNPKIDHGPKIPNIDKILHFGYFMIGGFCAANFFHIKSLFQWKKIFLIAILVGAIVGAGDEYRQSFTPGRSGNDIGDWIADVLGTLAGCIYCYYMWKRLNTTEFQK